MMASLTWSAVKGSLKALRSMQKHAAQILWLNSTIRDMHEDFLNLFSMLRPHPMLFYYDNSHGVCSNKSNRFSFRTSDSDSCTIGTERFIAVAPLRN